MSFEGLYVGMQLYNVSVTYNINPESPPLPLSAPIRVGPDLPDSSIDDAAVAMAAALNARDPDNAAPTLIELLLNDQSAASLGEIVSGAVVRDDFVAEGTWQAFGTDSISPPSAASPMTGYASFAAIPEPSPIICLSCVGLGFLGYTRYRSTRKAD